MEPYLRIHFVDYKNYSDVQVFEVGCQNCPPKHSYGPIVRGKFILHYVVEGQGKLLLGDTLNKELRKSERIRAKLFTSWEDEKITDNEFVQRKAVHNERIASIKQQIEALEDTIPQHEELEERIIQFREVMDALKDDTVSAEAKNVALKSIIERIYFSRENNSEFVLDIQTK